MKEEKEREVHGEADAFICTIMGNGSQSGMIQTSDGEELDFDHVVTTFDGDQWPQMRGKPKIFVFHTRQPGNSLLTVICQVRCCQFAKLVEASVRELT